MKSSVIFWAVASISAAFAAPLESPSNEAAKLFARGKLCLLEDGLACYYDNNACYWHACHNCECDDIYLGAKLIRRDCINSKDAPTCPVRPKAA
ncbi:hypothetical protein CkaCkLH20_10184 [Colletotrichum karsti]|uniref:Uncharacterized protein n=1 Tax=Colletotrichum karsti TaxID=1095194 RepID=A0A9P6LHA6_9PEZI|nr:uncharacterized protein CkaCkLH20_10184 [Colletotrichum karsti]KAF9872357.1 hypothetical protein CkaCkLH20_10184 [Colletotrichum karsti]